MPMPPVPRTCSTRYLPSITSPERAEVLPLGETMGAPKIPTHGQGCIRDERRTAGSVGLLSISGGDDLTRARERAASQRDEQRGPKCSDLRHTDLLVRG